MGVAIPEEYRGEMAMAGEWKTVSERAISGAEDEYLDQKPGSLLNVGVRKRKFEGQEEEEAAGETVARKGWGSGTRSYPGDAEDDDLDALLSGTGFGKPAKQPSPSFQDVDIDKKGEKVPSKDGTDVKTGNEIPAIKKVDSAPVKDYVDDEESTPTFVFKKRKAKVSKDK